MAYIRRINPQTQVGFQPTDRELKRAGLDYSSDAILVFGSETTGLPSEWLERSVTLPMLPGQRCLNLSTAVGIGLYEALRQDKFFEK